MKIILLTAALLLWLPSFGQTEEYRDVVYTNSKKNAALFDKSNPLSFINCLENAIEELKYSENYTGMSLSDAERVIAKGTDLSTAAGFSSNQGEISTLPYVTQNGEDSIIVTDWGEQYVYPPADRYYFITSGFDDIVIRERKSSKGGKTVYIPSQIFLRKKFKGIAEPVIAGRMDINMLGQVPVKMTQKLAPEERDQLLADFSAYVEKTKTFDGIPGESAKYLTPQYQFHPSAFEYFGESDFFLCNNWKNSGTEFPQFSDFIKAIRNNPGLVIKVDSETELVLDEATREAIVITDPKTGFKTLETRIRKDTSYFFSGNPDDVYVTKIAIFKDSISGWEETFTGLFFTKNLISGEKPVVLCEVGSYLTGSPDYQEAGLYMLLKFRELNDPRYLYAQNMKPKQIGFPVWPKQLSDHSLEWKTVKLSE